MERVCPECGASIGPDDGFCGECGAYLEWEERPAEPATEPAPGETTGPATTRRGLADRVRTAIGIAEDESATGTSIPTPAAMTQTPAAPTPAAPTPAAPTPAAHTAAARTSPAVGAPPVGDAPAPVLPAAPAPRPRRSAPSADREPVSPGDLVCGECGAGNEPRRKFCRRCGHDLTQAVIARTPWWRRLVARTPRTVAAGTRPAVPHPRLRPNRLVRYLVVLGVLAGAGYLGRGIGMGVVDAVLDRVMNVEEVNPSSWDASPSQPGHPPEAAREGATNKYWAPKEAGNGYLVAHFDEPVRLVYLNIAPGVVAGGDKEAFLAHGRPRTIKVTVSRADGSTVIETVDLKDRMGFQKFHVAVSDVTEVKLRIVRSYRGEHGTAIAEVEFYRRR